MKKLLLSLTCFACAFAFGQPVINLADITPQHNDTIRMQGLVSGSIFEIPTGEDITWDFSGSTPTSSTSITIYSNSTFQNSNYSTHSGPYMTVHYNYQSDGVYQTGVTTPEVNTTFTDSKKMLSFPLAATNINDTYSSTNTSFGLTNVTNGNYNATYQGYGTLITPAGTFTDVIMIRIIENSTITTNGNQGNMNHNDEVLFYKAGYAHPLYVAKMTIPQPSAWYQVVPVVEEEEEEEENPGTNVGINQPSTNAIQLVPNPVSDIATIVGGLETIIAVETLDLTGKKVNAIFEATSNTLNLSALPDGAYIVRVLTANGVMIKKILKK